MRQSLAVPRAGRTSHFVRFIVFCCFVSALAGCGRRSEPELKIGILVLQGRNPNGTNAPAGNNAAAGNGAPASPANPASPAGSPAPTQAATNADAFKEPAAAPNANRTGNGFGARALELALADLNAGEAGKSQPVRFVTLPADGNADNAVKAFRRLVEQEKVAAVVASVTSGEVLACAPIANQTHTVLLTTVATADDIRHAGDFVFRNVASTTASAKALADEVARRFPKAKTAIVYPELDFGLSYRDGLQGGLAAHGAPIPAIIPYPSRATDLKPTIERLAETQAPVVLIVGSQGDVRRLAQAARERGVKAPIFLGGDLSRSLADGFGPAGEGAIAAIDGFDPEASHPRTQAFVTAFRGRFGVLPSYFNATTYDALGIVAALMRQGATTGPALRDALYKTRGYIQVTGGELVFDHDGESGIPPRLVELRGGMLQPAR